jgi:hypothetical protein
MPPEGPQTIKAFVMIALLCMAAAAVLSLFPRGSKPGFAAAVCIVLLVAIFVSYGSPGTRRRVKLTDLSLMWAQWLQAAYKSWRSTSSLWSRRVWVSHRRSL